MQTITIEIEEHDALPDGCYMRFSALGPKRAVRRIQYELPSGSPAVCLVDGCGEDGVTEPAWAALVDDSSAGQSMLIGGGPRGVRVRPEAGGEAWAEPYLLLAPDALLEE